jgi:hypothetical protein
VKVLCNCAVCGQPVSVKQHQADTARTCGPSCAKALAMKEHPDDFKLSDTPGVGRSGYWRRRLATESNGSS